MEMKGESRIEAPRDRVWAALNDPEVLKASIPGCEELERTDDGGFAAKVRAKVGPVSARFGGKVALSDIDAPNGYRISGEGTGGAAGFAKGGADVKLEADGDQATILRYDVQATVGGKLAQIGSRLIDGTARKMADEFFASFKAQVEGAGGAAAEAPPVAAPPPQMAQGAAPTPPGQQPPPPQPIPRERPAETMPSEPPAHAGPTDTPSTSGAMGDPVAAASQPAAVDRAAETIRTGGHREHLVEDPEEASEASPGRPAAAEATAGPGGYRAEAARRSSTSPWVWAVGAAVVVVILIVAFA